MAAIANTSKQVAGAFSPASILLATSGDTLTYTANSSQELLLYNTDTVSRTVTIDGPGGTTVAVPGTGGATFSVAAGLVITVAAGTFEVVNLDKISAYVAGSPVSIVADVGAKVAASIIV